jgi:protein arginine N-methyltransferase 2
MTDENQPADVSENDILLAKRIISAAERHDLNALKILLKEGSASVKDSENGTTPLHAAISSCKQQQNGASTASAVEDKAAKTVEYLLLKGAIWNDLNNANETPGCIAFHLGLKKVYDIMVDAGVRAELLFGKLEELGLPFDENKVAVPGPGEEDYDVSQDNHAYLKAELRFKPGILLDSSDNAVMMDWEKTIMTRHAETLLTKPGLRALNIGHGMGIVDTAIQAREPSEHHIIEAHPQVLQKLRDNGWYEKPGVRIHEGRWQDVLPKMVEEGILLDAIYYDTFAEDYAALKELFSEWVIQIMDSNGRFGWYNGLGADRQICYDVYTKVSCLAVFLCFRTDQDTGC